MTDSQTPLPPLTQLDYERFAATGENPRPVQALQIETSSICNFRCPSCPLGDKAYDRPEKHMTPDQFRRVLEAFPEARKVELQGIGEVFLNDQVFEIIREARDRGVEVHTFSNASLIDPDLARRIVESGLALINFSLDGADEPTFRKFRKGGTLARYEECVGNLVEARRAAGSTTPQIGAMSVLNHENVRQVPDLLAIAERLGMDTIIFTKMNAAAGSDRLSPLLLTEEDREWLRSQPPHDGSIEVVWAFEPWTEQQRRECYWPQQMTYVTVEGDVTACCNYYDSRELCFGNVFEQSGAEIWNGEKYKAFRRQLVGGELPLQCKLC
jgi:radical SAM protein with 4Fe4S-binding SPASM domain